MAKYYIDTNEGRKYIKEIDYAQGKLTFTNNTTEAYKDRDGYYANATRDLIRRGFSDDYPEIENLQCVAPYY